MSDLREEDNVVPGEEEDQPVEEEGSGKTEYIEFLGTDSRFGTEFYGATGTHEVTKKHLKQVHDVDTDKDLVWQRGKKGRFLVPVSDMSPEAAEVLENDPMFKRVTLSN